ncbi:Bacillus subtilis phage SP02 gene L for DNA polymerase [Bacillus subtilis]|nr:hypothetical protein NRS6153_01850 [Bacillus subtilis]CAI6292964.1 Bacillus subtilis phage SP02 gene L for DNA polymerase [Bacillus subtilis]
MSFIRSLIGVFGLLFSVRKKEVEYYEWIERDGK